MHTNRFCRPVRLDQYVNHDPRLIFETRLLFEEIRYTFALTLLLLQCSTAAVVTVL